MRLSRPGYTLFELALVLALIVVLGALVYPSLEAMHSDLRVSAAADAVRAAWASARAQAMNEGRAYRFAVVPNKGNFRVAPDTGEFWAGGESRPPTEEGSEPPLVLEEVLPSKVRFTLGNAMPDDTNLVKESSLLPENVEPGMWAPVATFLPDGTAREDIEIRLHSPGARSVIVRLRGLTGAVTVQPLQEEW